MLPLCYYATNNIVLDCREVFYSTERLCELTENEVGNNYGFILANMNNSQKHSVNQ